jgi:cell division protein FtsB
MKERVNTTKRYRHNSVSGNNALKMEEVKESRANTIQSKDAFIQTKSQKIKSLKRRLKEESAKINRVCTFVNAFVIIATLAICVVFLKTQFNYHTLNQEIELKKQELSTLRKETIQIQEDIKAQIDLEYIYSEATTRLGMRLPGPGDVYVIDIEPLTYTSKLASVEVEENKTTLGNVLGYITRGW